MVLSRRPAGSPLPGDDAPEGSARLDDAETVARLAGGDVRALGVLYDRFGESVYSLARSVCGDAAEDVTREVFLAVRRHADRFDPARGSVATWVLTMARHRAVEARRRGSGRGDGPEVDQAADLTPEQRVVVGLTYAEGFTATEIASITGRSVDEVLADAATAMTVLRPDADDPT